MKSIFLLLTTLFVNSILFAQAPPEAFNYSGAARDAQGNPISEKTIGVELSILKGSPTGALQYRERHFVNTDKFGVFNCTVGQGSVQQGTFSAVNWSNDSYYLRVGLDANGGTNFVVLGTTQLLSVPYALYAKNAGSVNGSGGGSVKPYVVADGVGNLIFINGTFRFKGAGIVYSEGTSPVTEKGYVWSNATLPTISNNKTSFGSGPGEFEGEVLGLTGDPIYARPYATNAAGTSYGEEDRLIIGTLPAVSTNSCTQGAFCSYSISNVGNPQITNSGIAWSSTQNFTEPEGVVYGNKSVVGTHEILVTGLTLNKTYYVKAFVERDDDYIFYGNEVTLTPTMLGVLPGTYIGKHIISDPTLIQILKGIDPNSDGTINDTIIVSNGSGQYKYNFTCSSFNDVPFEVDLTKTGNNVTQKNLGNTNFFPGYDDGILLENTVIKSSSRVTPTSSTSFTTIWNISGTLTTPSINFPIGNLTTTGTFIKQ